MKEDEKIEVLRAMQTIKEVVEGQMQRDTHRSWNTWSETDPNYLFSRNAGIKPPSRDYTHIGTFGIS